MQKEQFLIRIEPATVHEFLCSDFAIFSTSRKINYKVHVFKNIIHFFLFTRYDLLQKFRSSRIPIFQSTESTENTGQIHTEQTWCFKQNFLIKLEQEQRFSHIFLKRTTLSDIKETLLNVENGRKEVARLINYHSSPLTELCVKQHTCKIPQKCLKQRSQK